MSHQWGLSFPLIIIPPMPPTRSSSITISAMWRNCFTKLFLKWSSKTLCKEGKISCNLLLQLKVPFIESLSPLQYLTLYWAQDCCILIYLYYFHGLVVQYKLFIKIGRIFTHCKIWLTIFIICFERYSVCVYIFRRHLF